MTHTSGNKAAHKTNACKCKADQAAMVTMQPVCYIRMIDCRRASSFHKQELASVCR